MYGLRSKKLRTSLHYICKLTEGKDSDLEAEVIKALEGSPRQQPVLKCAGLPGWAVVWSQREEVGESDRVQITDALSGRRRNVEAESGDSQGAFLLFNFLIHIFCIACLTQIQLGLHHLCEDLEPF